MNSGKKEMDFEKEMWELILFVAESGKIGRQKVAQLNRIFEKYLQKGYHIDLVCLPENPEKAYRYEIIAVPTLIRLAPEPTVRIVGDFSNPSRLMRALGVHPLKNR